MEKTKAIASGNENYHPEDFSQDMEVYEAFEDYESFGEPEAPTQSSGDIYREIDALSSYARSQGASAEVLKTLEEKKRLAMQSAAFSPEKREEILDEIRGSLNELQDKIHAAIESAPARESLRKELQELRSELQAELEDADAKKEISEKIAEAEKSLKNMDLEAAQENFEEAKSELDSLKEEVETQRAENNSEAEAMLKELQGKIESSKILDSKKEELKTKIEALKSQLGDRDLDFSKFQENMESLQNEVSKELKIATLRASFQGFATKIPAFENSTLTSELATKFANAMASGDWQPFLSALAEAGNKDASGTYHAMRQIVGTIFYDLAGGSEDQLEQFLDLIPTNVRKAMYNRIMPYKDNNHWSSNETDRFNHRLYGNYGGEVANRLEQSWAKDDLTGEESQPA